VRGRQWSLVAFDFSLRRTMLSTSLLLVAVGATNLSSLLVAPDAEGTKCRMLNEVFFGDDETAKSVVPNGRYANDFRGGDDKPFSATFTQSVRYCVVPPPNNFCRRLGETTRPPSLSSKPAGPTSSPSGLIPQLPTSTSAVSTYLGTISLLHADLLHAVRLRTARWPTALAPHP
jgi:hypothetical protein